VHPDAGSLSPAQVCSLQMPVCARSAGYCLERSCDTRTPAHGRKGTETRPCIRLALPAR
jgi:hypothetical protein